MPLFQDSKSSKRTTNVAAVKNNASDTVDNEN
jgi:hypothetical protein